MGILQTYFTKIVFRRRVWLGLLSVLAAIACSDLVFPHFACCEDYKHLELSVEPNKGARLFWGNLLIAPSIGGKFEFFTKGLTGRKRLLIGPWRGSMTGILEKTYANEFQIEGANHKENASFYIRWVKIDSNTIDLLAQFAAPDKDTHLSLEILKLESSLFKGAEMVVQDEKSESHLELPFDPRSLKNRILFRKKKAVRILSSLCEIQLKDMTGRSPIIGADFRDTPWDRHKSFYFAAEDQHVKSGQTVNYHYRIKIIPSEPSVSVLSFKAAPVSPKNLTVGYKAATTFFLPEFKVRRLQKGFFQLSDYLLIGASSETTATAYLQQCISEMFNIETSFRKISSSRLERGIYIEVPGRIGDGIEPLPPEGFEISVKKERINLFSADQRGCLYGIYALSELLKASDEEGTIQQGDYRDWPDLPVRAMLMEMLPPANHDVALFRKYIRLLSLARFNRIIFWHKPSHIQQWEETEKCSYWTRDTISEMAAYARSLHMEVWGGLSGKFSPITTPGLTVAAGTNIYDVTLDTSYEKVFELYDRIIEAYHPAGMLIGKDEIKGLLIYTQKTGKPAHKLFADDINRIAAWLRSKGIKTMIAGDMLLEYNKWNYLITGVNSDNPVYNSGKTHLAIDLLPKDIQIFDWHYQFVDNYSSIRYFKTHGFGTFGGSWHDPHAACAMAKSLKRYNGEGIIGSDFGFWYTLSPAATTLCSGLCGWSTDFCGKMVTDSDLYHLAEFLQNKIDIKKMTQVPINLKTFANTGLTDTIAGDGKGFMDAGPFFDLRNLETGKNNYAEVSFDIAASSEEQSGTCIVSFGQQSSFETTVNHPAVELGNFRADGIAFLHTCFIQEPQYQQRKIGEYIVEFDNGDQAVLELLENWNITDIRSNEHVRYTPWTFYRKPEVLLGSKTGWNGWSGNHEKLNLQMFYWENPMPEKRIKIIRLKTTLKDPNTAIALIGLTVLQK